MSNFYMRGGDNNMSEKVSIGTIQRDLNESWVANPHGTWKEVVLRITTASDDGNPHHADQDLAHTDALKDAALKVREARGSFSIRRDMPNTDFPLGVSNGFRARTVERHGKVTGVARRSGQGRRQALRP